MPNSNSFPIEKENYTSLAIPSYYPIGGGHSCRLAHRQEDRAIGCPNSVADPGSGGFFTPGSGLGEIIKIRIRDQDPG
jgi:hypothetical protein